VNGAVRHIAMWSGPRNISTAMMRSWGNRPDTFVCDEPLYAYFLRATGAPHPGADEIIRHYENDWQKVVDWLTGPVPEGKTVFFQKHMTHHMLPGIDRAWLGRVNNAFLIREPREVLTSYVRIMPNPTVEDTGLPQQLEIYHWVCRQTGRIPPVVDAAEILENPERMLRALCAGLGVEFVQAMLSWPPGPRATDGIWAKHWYGAVLESTSFQPHRPKNETVPAHLNAVLKESEELYHQLYQHRLRA